MVLLLPSLCKILYQILFQYPYNQDVFLLNNFKNIPAFYPQLKEDINIFPICSCGEYNTSYDGVENLQSTIRNQQSALAALPQAILRKAFRGEL
ncbi:MAG: hypothetical protein HY578_09500 [Nitrospinae bacterium]|nr:hypothetical protein [Nitrospinota bacterium]